MIVTSFAISSLPCQYYNVIPLTDKMVFSKYGRVLLQRVFDGGVCSMLFGFQRALPHPSVLLRTIRALPCQAVMASIIK